MPISASLHLHRPSNSFIRFCTMLERDSTRASPSSASVHWDLEPRPPARKSPSPSSELRRQFLQGSEATIKLVIDWILLYPGLLCRGVLAFSERFGHSFHGAILDPNAQIHPMTQKGGRQTDRQPYFSKIGRNSMYIEQPLTNRCTSRARYGWERLTVPNTDIQIFKTRSQL